MEYREDFGAEDEAQADALQRRQAKRCLYYAVLGVFSIDDFD